MLNWTQLWGTFCGLKILNHLACNAPEGAPSTFSSFPGLERLHGPSCLCGFVDCYAFLPEGLGVADSGRTTCSWVLNQASCSWPTSSDLMRRFSACAGYLGQIVPDPAFFFVVFLLSSNDWKTWVNSAFRKTWLFKNCTSERLSLPFISEVDIYNPLSALLLTLACHFYHVLLRVAIFVLNVAIPTDFNKETNRIVHKNSFLENTPTQSCPIFTAHALWFIFSMRRRRVQPEMGLVRITSWYPNFNGSHFGLPPSEIDRVTAELRSSSACAARDL